MDLLTNGRLLFSDRPKPIGTGCLSGNRRRAAGNKKGWPLSERPPINSFATTAASSYGNVRSRRELWLPCGRTCLFPLAARQAQAK